MWSLRVAYNFELSLRWVYCKGKSYIGGIVTEIESIYYGWCFYVKHCVDNERGYFVFLCNYCVANRIYWVWLQVLNAYEGLAAVIRNFRFCGLFWVTGVGCWCLNWGWCCCWGWCRCWSWFSYCNIFICSCFIYLCLILLILLCWSYCWAICIFAGITHWHFWSLCCVNIRNDAFVATHKKHGKVHTICNIGPIPLHKIATCSLWKYLWYLFQDILLTGISLLDLTPFFLSRQHVLFDNVELNVILSVVDHLNSKQAIYKSADWS